MCRSQENKENKVEDTRKAKKLKTEHYKEERNKYVRIRREEERNFEVSEEEPQAHL